MAPRAIIIGAPGAGKTSVGRRVAERLGVEFRDSDAAIEKRAGKPVSDIFLSDGETAFRRLEREVIAAFSHHTVVWLEVDLGNATKRVGMNSARPLLMGNVRGTMTTMLNERTPLYEEVATVTVDTSGRPLKDVVNDVVAELKRVGTPS